MTLGPWEVLSERQLIKTRWLDAREETCRTPSGAIVNDYAVVHYADWAAAAAVTAEGGLIMTRQWRQGAQAMSLEFAGGVVDPGETPAQAAARELLEETGYCGVHREPVLKTRPNPATQRNWFHVNLFIDCTKRDEPRLDETEVVQTVVLTPDEAVQAIRAGVLIHTLHVAAVFATLNLLKEPR